MPQRGLQVSVVTRGGQAAPISRELLSRVSSAAQHRGDQYVLTHSRWTSVMVCHLHGHHLAPFILLYPCHTLPHSCLHGPDPSFLLFSSFGQERATLFFLFNKLCFCLARELHNESNKPWSWCTDALLWVWAPGSPFLGISHLSLPLNTAVQKSTE